MSNTDPTFLDSVFHMIFPYHKSSHLQVELKELDKELDGEVDENLM